MSLKIVSNSLGMGIALVLCSCGSAKVETNEASAPKESKAVIEKAAEKKEMVKKVATKAAATAEKAVEKVASETTGSLPVTAGVVTCKNGGDTRTLEKKTPEGGGCEVVYTKDGVASSIANAKNQIEYCDQVLEKVKTRLAQSGWTCE